MPINNNSVSIYPNYFQPHIATGTRIACMSDLLEVDNASRSLLFLGLGKICKIKKKKKYLNAIRNCKKSIGQIFLTDFLTKHRWFSGRMLACHAGGPGSILARCNFLCSKCSKSTIKMSPVIWVGYT